MSSPEAPAGRFAGLGPVGVMTADDESCMAVAIVLAAAISGLPVETGRATCGRPAALSRGVTALPATAFEPARPFSGPLFAAVESLALVGRLAATGPLAADGSGLGGRRAAVGSGAPCIALVVPLTRLPALDDAQACASPPPVGGTTEVTPAPAADEPTGGLVVIADHVDLAGRGPLTGRWPAGRPRRFPALNGIYAPDVAVALLQAGDAAGAVSRATTAAGKCEPADGRSAAGPAVYSRLAVAGVADTGRPTVFEVEQARAAGLSWASSCLVAPVVIAAYYGLVVAAVGVLHDR